MPVHRAGLNQLRGIRIVRTPAASFLAAAASSEAEAASFLAAAPEAAARKEVRGKSSAAADFGIVQSGWRADAG